MFVPITAPTLQLIKIMLKAKEFTSIGKKSAAIAFKIEFVLPAATTIVRATMLA